MTRTHEAPLPSVPELIERLTACAAALEHLSNKTGGEYQRYWFNRAAHGSPTYKRGIASGMSGLREFEAIAL